MLKNNTRLNKFYKNLIKQEKFSYKTALRIYEMLHKEAISLKAINSKNILDGLEADLRIAKILNSLK